MEKISVVLPALGALRLPIGNGLYDNYAPQEIKNWEINLSTSYDFSATGKYKVEIIRKITIFDNRYDYQTLSKMKQKSSEVKNGNIKNIGFVL